MSSAFIVAVLIPLSLRIFHSPFFVPSVFTMVCGFPPPPPPNCVSNPPGTSILNQDFAGLKRIINILFVAAALVEQPHNCMGGSALYISNVSSIFHLFHEPSTGPVSFSFSSIFKQTSSSGLNVGAFSFYLNELGR